MTNYIQLVYLYGHPLFPGLNSSDIFRTVYLLSYCGENNLLCRSIDNPLVDPEKIERLLRLGNKSHTKRFMQKLIDNRILFKEDGKYYISDECCVRQRMSYEEQQDIYRDKNIQCRVYRGAVRQLYNYCHDNKNVVSTGTVFKLLPYCHRTTNVICSNPTEEDLYRVHPLSIREMAEELDITRRGIDHVRETMTLPVLDGEPVWGEDARNKIYWINPKLAQAGIHTSSPLELIRRIGRYEPNITTRNMSILQ